MIIEAWFFLLALNGNGKAALNVGPFFTQVACEEIKRQASKEFVSGTYGCWRGPVVVSK